MKTNADLHIQFKIETGEWFQREDIKRNNADLHIQFKIETGEWFQWKNSKHNNATFTADGGFTYEYTQWLEEQLLQILNKNN